MAGLENQLFFVSCSRFYRPYHTMCTVTFLPTGTTQFVLTSNRDEAPNRETIPPRFYKFDGTNMLFPKDKRAGGTWIGLSDKQRLVCLLNGGFMLHERQAKYRMSRGVVVREMLESDDIVTLIEGYDLNNIEPFTLILIEWRLELKLYELVWDGHEKHFSRLPLEPKLWSSSTLYNREMKDDRQMWFKGFLNVSDVTAESILDFHETAGKETMDYGVIMDRGFVKTTSITQVQKINNVTRMRYHDLENDAVRNVDFEIPEIINE